MKIRNGFVSNSSSSSFVLFLEKMPESVGETQRLLFGDKTEYPSPYGGRSFDARAVAEIVFRDIKAGVVPEEALAERAARWHSDEPDYPAYPNFGYKSYEGGDRQLGDWITALIWGRHVFELKAFGEKKAKEVREKYPNRVIVQVEYSDNNGDLESAMENGNLFDDLDHIRISNH